MSKRGTLAVVGPNPTFRNGAQKVSVAHEGDLVVLVVDEPDWEGDYITRKSADEGGCRVFLDSTSIRFSIVVLNEQEILDFTGLNRNSAY